MQKKYVQRRESHKSRSKEGVTNDDKKFTYRENNFLFRLVTGNFFFLSRISTLLRTSLGKRQSKHELKRI